MGPQESPIVRVWLVVGPVLVAAPSTRWITDGHHGRADAPTAKSRAFLLTVEEVRVAPNVVTGMYLIHWFLFILN